MATRRELVCGIGLALGAVALGRDAASGVAGRVGLGAVLAQLVGDVPTACRLGTCYLQRGTAVDVMARRSTLEGLPQLDLETVRSHLLAERSRDLGTGDTVLVDGWVLARSEAELLAVLASC